MGKTEEAHFILSKSKLLKQYQIVSGLADRVAYSYKTNPLVGNLLEKLTDCNLSVHFVNSLKNIKDKKRVWFLGLALSKEAVDRLLSQGIRSFIIENKPDLDVLLERIEKRRRHIDLLLRMRMKEHTVKTETHYVYGMLSSDINVLIPELRKNKYIDKLGVHFHRKTENIGEWEIKEELEEMLSESTFDNINIIDIGGGIPVAYKNYSGETLPYIFNKIKEARKWANKRGIKLIVEPGRFIAAPCIELHTTITAISGNTLFLNCSVYNSAMDTINYNIKLLVKGELASGNGKRYLLKGCTPDSLDIFRYSVYLKDAKIGNKIIFTNAGAYTYSTNFCDLEPLKTVIIK